MQVLGEPHPTPSPASSTRPGQPCGCDSYRARAETRQRFRPFFVNVSSTFRQPRVARQSTRRRRISIPTGIATAAGWRGVRSAGGVMNRHGDWHMHRNGDLHRHGDLNRHLHGNLNRRWCWSWVGHRDGVRLRSRHAVSVGGRSDRRRPHSAATPSSGRRIPVARPQPRRATGEPNAVGRTRKAAGKTGNHGRQCGRRRRWGQQNHSRRGRR